jgi:hypothetical protein
LHAKIIPVEIWDNNLQWLLELINFSLDF